jgi:bacillolysin
LRVASLLGEGIVADGFTTLQFHIADESGPHGVAESRGTMRGVARATAPETAPNQESAARMYLGVLLGGQDQPASVRGLAAPDQPELVPDLRLRDTQTLRDTSLVRFVQTKKSIPIFGSRAVVELDPSNELVSVDATLAEVKGVSHIPALGAAQALEQIAALCGAKVADLQDVDAPELQFFYDDETDKWHLVYVFQNVPAAPEGFIAGLKSHGVGHSPNQHFPELDYLVDTHDGKVLLYWSSAPTANGDVPTSSQGDDEDGERQKFFGRALDGGGFELYDPMRGIKTYDFGGQDIDKGQLPATPITVNGPKSEFLGMPAAVSAHYHAKCVDDFLRSVLVRNGIDNKGMELISCVNCISLQDGPGPEWPNAAWWRKRMWYGQAQENGGMRSYSRFLDVIAHELAHGITETTANLAYIRQSGALNESFSDIFGVIISNWDWTKTDTTGGDVSDWDWEIGKGLGGNNLPLRDFSDPTRTGDPDHMNKFVKTFADNGGVHTNSNIHNKAAYNVLTSKDGQGGWLFSPRDVAILYYYCLLRLGRLATFKQARASLSAVAKTYFMGTANPQEQLDAIDKAYDAVGIA